VIGPNALQSWQSKSRSDVSTPSWRRFLIGESPAIQQLCDIIQLVASKRVTVLISGETGTGKEVVARAIHAASPRAVLPIVAVNCTALPSNLVESELFGHAKGAFTGAHTARTGRFEQANRSTIFLDEVGDLPLEAQAKLLRVLQEQEFERVGSSETVRVDVRVVAASNVELDQAVRDRRFREDLFYRLNVVPIHLVPLRERPEDIPLLLEYFIEKTRVSEHAGPKQISDEAVDFLIRQDWPGNVRQLEHAVQMAFALSGDRYTLQVQDFCMRNRDSKPSLLAASNPDKPLVTVGADGVDFDAVVSNFERSLLTQALAVAGGNKARAADLLRIKRTTLLAKMKVFDERELDQPSGPVRIKPRVAPATRTAAIVAAKEDAIRKMVGRTLEEEGYRVLEATSGAAALELFECWKSHIRLIIAAPDYRSTINDDLIETLRERTSGNLSAIIISDDCRPGLSRYSPGPWTGLLPQPFSPRDLVAALGRLSVHASFELAGVVCA
jgi:DNA-binding NtrC family response regulator